MSDFECSDWDGDWVTVRYEPVQAPPVACDGEPDTGTCERRPGRANAGCWVRPHLSREDGEA